MYLNLAEAKFFNYIGRAEKLTLNGRLSFKSLRDFVLFLKLRMPMPTTSSLVSFLNNVISSPISSP